MENGFKIFYFYCYIFKIIIFGFVWVFLDILEYKMVVEFVYYMIK